ncbi:26S proteasome complex subunit [Coniosporium apollinis]|uniref:26S proteasome complex subunit SEM1 n=2 Tax=Coniosporium TaxID=2810619 RepID=A0ABQ9P4Q2_9PEZI|nr:26S proteasome complex subunit [Cladosporium sp. JES 115]KAJ9668524.1 26S proteasome complex subunit [Coniosporium apollinis]
MSGAGNTAPGPDTTKAVVSDTKDTSPSLKDQLKPAATLEEDDEFEDFPAEDWQQEDTEIPGGNTHLWEESWDDDDTNGDFSAQLK